MFLAPLPVLNPFMTVPSLTSTVFTKGAILDAILPVSVHMECRKCLEVKKNYKINFRRCLQESIPKSQLNKNSINNKSGKSGHR